MDDDDFRSLIGLVQAELIASGAPDLADERHYAEDRGEDGRVQLPPQKLLVEMLIAFDRHMAMRDHATYRDAMRSISNTVDGEGPEYAAVEQIRLSEFSDTAPEASLDDAPNLGPVRRELRVLIGALLETPRGFSF
jgi:hypothetical protein